jgi:outer membrane protein OmpA-like peptidoglycan-associated protein
MGNESESKKIEEATPGSSGIELIVQRKCRLRSSGTLRCFCDVEKSKWPECRGPNDLGPIGKVYIGSGWEDLTSLINKMLESGRELTLHFRRYEIIRRKPDPKFGPRDGKVMYVEEIQLDMHGQKKGSVKDKDEEEKESEKKSETDKIEWNESDKQIMEKPSEFENVIDIIRKLEQSKKLRKVVIRGYTDLRGGEKYNINLSKARAEWIRTTLTERFGLLSHIPTTVVACGKFFALKSPADSKENRVVTIELDVKKTAPPDTSKPFIVVNTPIESSTVEYGEKLEITWESNIAEDVRIELYRTTVSSELQHYKNIKESVTNNGNFEWTIPKRFKIEEGSLCNLELLDNLPEDTMLKLGELKNREFLNEEEFSEILTSTIGKNQTFKYFSRICLRSFNPAAPDIDSYYQIKITSVMDDTIFGFSEFFSVDDYTREDFHIISFHDYYYTRAPKLKEPIYISPYRRMEEGPEAEPWKQEYMTGWKFYRVKALRTSELLPGMQRDDERVRPDRNSTQKKEKELRRDKKRTSEIIKLGKKYIRLFKEVLGETNKDWYQKKCEDKLNSVFIPRLFDVEKKPWNEWDDIIELPWEPIYYMKGYPELPIPTAETKEVIKDGKVKFEYEHSYDKYYKEKNLQTELIYAHVDRNWEKRIKERMKAYGEIEVGVLKIHFKTGEPKS